MLRAEARWFGRELAKISDEVLFPLLDVGSHTSAFRAREQPWIDEFVFSPLARRGSIVHTDLREGPGIDLVGDVTDQNFVERLRRDRFRSVFCANVLEHVDDPGALAEALVHIVTTGGILAISVPFRFPYHPDPIDNGFRPDLDELADLLPGTRRMRGQILPCGTFLHYLTPRLLHPVALVSKIVRRKSLSAGDDALDGGESLLPWFFRRFLVTCLILEKTS